MTEKNNLFVDFYVFLKRTFFGRAIEKKLAEKIVDFVKSIFEKTNDKMLAERILWVAKQEWPKYLDMKDEDVIKRLGEISKIEKNKLEKQCEKEKAKKDRTQSLVRLMQCIAKVVALVIEGTGDKLLGERTQKAAEQELPKYLSMKNDDIAKRLDEIVKTEKNKLKKQREEEKAKKDRFIKELNKKVGSFNESWLTFLGENDYLITLLKGDLETEINNCFNLIKNRPKLMEKDERFEQELKKNQAELNNFENQIRVYNEGFIEKMKLDCADIFKKSTVELNESQINAIITDDKHNLVVAGAGSGKTKVLTDRIAYLVKKPNGVDAKRILALAFQSEAKEEIEKRLKTNHGLAIEVRTFHALGLAILREAGLTSLVKFGEDNFKQCHFIREIYEKELGSSDFRTDVLSFIGEYGDPEEVKKKADFQGPNAKYRYWEYLDSLRYTALDGTPVKSLAEKEILNFFITHKLNGQKIEPIYEDPAEWMEYTDAKGIKHTPKPDFFLKEYDIYIENWALDENKTVPKWFRTPAAYKKGMNAKKAKFAEQKKYSLVETFSYEFKNPSEGILQLEKRLQKEFERKNPEKEFKFEVYNFAELVEKICDAQKQRANSIAKYIADFITNAKTYDLSPEKIERRLIEKKWSEKQKRFARIALSIYRIYEKELKEEKGIDFCDMINQAIKALENDPDLYKDKFDRILIDEFQDISKQRFLLIKALMEKNKDCRLFCVGDDWQSIMAFSGSRLEYFVQFKKYFPDSVITRLSMNYRSVKPIVDAGAAIIRNNGNSQIQKETFAKRKDGKKPVLFSLKHTLKYKRNYYKQMAKHCLDRVSTLLKNGSKPEDIMILSRIKPAKGWLAQDVQRCAKEMGIKLIEASKKPDSIRFLTVHESKGSEAKIVFILDVTKDPYGFPCELEDLDIMAPAIDAEPIKKEEEERRLFYVAVTRAKDEAIIYTLDCAESKFIQEIKEYVDQQPLYYDRPAAQQPKIHSL